VIDLAVAVATAALVAVGDKPARRARNAASNATLAATRPTTRTATPSRATARSNRAVPASADAVSAGPTATTRTVNDAAMQLAADLVSAKVTRQPVATVEAILAAHDNGDPMNRIAANLGVHHSAVKRVLGAAEANSQRYLLAAS